MIGVYQKVAPCEFFVHLASDKAQGMVNIVAVLLSTLLNIIKVLLHILE